MSFAIVVGLRFVVVNFESILRMGLIMNHLVFSTSINKRVPTFHVSMAVSNLVPLLWIFLVARGITKLVTLRPMKTLKKVTKQRVRMISREESSWIYLQSRQFDRERLVCE